MFVCMYACMNVCILLHILSSYMVILYSEYLQDVILQKRFSTVNYQYVQSRYNNTITNNNSDVNIHSNNTNNNNNNNNSIYTSKINIVDIENALSENGDISTKIDVISTIMYSCIHHYKAVMETLSMYIYVYVCTYLPYIIVYVSSHAYTLVHVYFCVYFGAFFCLYTHLLTLHFL